MTDSIAKSPESRTARKAGGLDLHASGVFSRPYGRGIPKARQGFKRCGCNPAMAGFENNQSSFMLKNIPLFFERFSLSYFKEGSCIEYFINRRCSSETISAALILSHNPFKNALHVSRFYPELYLLPNSKYMSATCFYLLIQHCAGVFTLDDKCHISLETVPNVSDRFYRKLGDFNFTVRKSGIGDVVELVSGIFRSTVDTSMISLHILQPGEIPFMK